MPSLYIIVSLVILVVVLFFTQSMRDGAEPFGMSPGTMDQLQSTAGPRTIPGVYQAPIWVADSHTI